MLPAAFSPCNVSSARSNSPYSRNDASQSIRALDSSLMEEALLLLYSEFSCWCNSRATQSYMAPHARSMGSPIPIGSKAQAADARSQAQDSRRAVTDDNLPAVRSCASRDVPAWTKDMPHPPNTAGDSPVNPSLEEYQLGSLDAMSDVSSPAVMNDALARRRQSSTIANDERCLEGSAAENETTVVVLEWCLQKKNRQSKRKVSFLCHRR